MKFKYIKIAFVEYIEYQLPYSKLYSLPKRPTFSKIREGGLDNGEFLKNFQNFLKFCNFYTKSATGGLFYYYDIVFK